MSSSHAPSVLRIATTVFWSFFGVRKRSRHDVDTVTLKPLHLIAGAVLGAALFVGTLLTAVHFITR
ncbi:MAG: DUF2970 domain-containing protein [Methyloversatilis sp.]|jgi:hypothetical protein|uniref:DUF2970 domain-containing protein n=1 Tax=Methyloversatilis TaxID=378210 RepID=UPI00045E96DA|nr:DUF2970 domain-containing protein [Methyloversatilis discipulorum]MBC7207848.1 DUF2970 domain-containing protein [Methyloversatilis sp.]MBT9519163.1 DUF2970 domain-containing protein [Methyloversatilis discipulorum]MDY0057708.1 DUF2970 domain-containing protein [Methyloversatilis sp.]PZU55244.1 MAG: DUF2970 domain-containing protein [Thauera sp.]